jgi:hypothetical protein
MGLKWIIEEDKWEKNYKWFLIDDGEIQYSFLNKREALLFQKYHMLQHMLLTNNDKITHDTMLEPKEFRSWSEKIQKTVLLA